jgi:Skp family chaperone for outer membrane proteins
MFSKFQWALCGGLVLLGVLLARAFGQDAPAKHCDVAVVDISVVFEKYEAFQQRMKDLKTQVEAFEIDLNALKDELEASAKELAKLKPASKEHTALLEEMAAKKAAATTTMETRRAEFLKQEATIYYDHYELVHKAVADVARARGIRLVVRFNSEQMRKDDRNSVLQGVNRAVVFHDELDITSEIVAQLNHS